MLAAALGSKLDIPDAIYRFCVFMLLDQGSFARLARAKQQHHGRVEQGLGDAQLDPAWVNRFGDLAPMVG